MTFQQLLNIERALRIEKRLTLYFVGDRYKILVDVCYGRRHLPDWFPYKGHNFTPKEQTYVLAKQAYFELGTVLKGMETYGYRGVFGRELVSDIQAAKKFIEGRFDMSGVNFGKVPLPVP